MKRNLISLVAIIGLATLFSSCEKEEYFMPTPDGGEVNKSKVMYVYTPNTSLKSSGSNEQKTGEIQNGDSLKFAVPGSVLFYTMPADGTCNWTIGSVAHTSKDQLRHDFADYGDYSSTVVGENTNLRSFVVSIKQDDDDDNDDDDDDDINNNIFLSSKTDKSTYWELIFHVKNQQPGYAASAYGHVGNGYTGSSWTPQFNSINLHPSITNLLVYEMRVPKSYTGKVKFCLTMGTSWFNPNLDDLGGLFWNTSTANDQNEQIWQFNVVGSSGIMTSWNGVTISPAGPNNLPGKINDGVVGFTINNQVGGDESLTIYVKSSSSNELRYASDSVSSSTIPQTLTAIQLEGVTGYDDWKQCKIPRANIKKYTWFHFGTNSNGVYTRNTSCDGSSLFVSTQSAFRIMS